MPASFKCLFPSSFPIKLCMCSSSHVCHMPHHFTFFHLVNLIIVLLGENEKLSSSLSSSLRPRITVSLFGPDILLSPLLLSISNVFFINVRGQVPYPYKTTGKIIVLYILILRLLCSRRNDKRF
jgi:hypothetical protein